MLRTDVLIGAVIFAFTAVPVALRLPSRQMLHDVVSIELFPVDIVANVLGYVPLGLVLAKRGVLCSLLVAGLLSAFAEATQLFSAGRDPSVVDVVTNLVGTGIGLFVAARGRRLPDELAVTPRGATAALVAAVLYVAFGSTFTAEGLLHRVSGWLEAPPWMTTSSHGATSAGTLEAHLSFEDADDGVVSDASENRIRAVPVNRPTISRGVIGSAIALDGTQWVDLGDPMALRLTGSMTLSAWVRPAAFPVDDAAIISSLSDNELGYQLDLTIDEGPRTIGFKLAGESGQLMTRYGRTPLVAGRWYHVVGVYDAPARTLDVYLDGHLDNGCLLGAVTGRQKPSNQRVLVGRRAGSSGFEFIGSIDEVQIQSRARTASDIETEHQAAGRFEDVSTAAEGHRDVLRVCLNQPRVPRLAGPLVTLGMLFAIGCVGLWRGRRLDVVVFASCVLAGVMASVWGSLATMWLSTLCVLSGGVVVLAAQRMRSRR